MHTARTLCVASAVTAMVGGSIGCGQKSAVEPPAAAYSTASRTEPSIPKVSGYAYVADANGGDTVFAYVLPLTNDSEPVWQIGGLNAPGAIGFDPGQVFVAVANPGILVYESTKHGPVSFVIALPYLPTMTEVDQAGDLFEGQVHSYTSYYGAYPISVFTRPVKKSGAPAFTMLTAINKANSRLTRGFAFDVHGNLWVKDDDNQTMDKYVPPFSATSVPILTFPKGSGAPYGSMVFDQKDTMFVTDGGGIDVYRPPFTKKTMKQFTINVPADSVSLAVDAAGDLYATSSTGVLNVFVPPFSPSSVPQTTLTVPGGAPLAFVAIRS